LAAFNACSSCAPSSHSGSISPLMIVTGGRFARFRIDRDHGHRLLQVGVARGHPRGDRQVAARALARQRDAPAAVVVDDDGDRPWPDRPPSRCPWPSSSAVNSGLVYAIARRAGPPAPSRTRRRCRG
jgi:hypothetical protein